MILYNTEEHLVYSKHKCFTDPDFDEGLTIVKFIRIETINIHSMKFEQWDQLSFRFQTYLIKISPYLISKSI